MAPSKPPPFPNPGGENDASRRPRSLTIQEALSKANRERVAEFANSQLPPKKKIKNKPQPSNSGNPPYAFVNPQDVEQVDTTRFWPAGEQKSEQSGNFLRLSRREMKEQKKDAKGSDDGQKKKDDDASVEKDVEVEEASQGVDDDDGELQSEPKKEANEWKFLKEIEAGLPPRRRSGYRQDTDSNAG